MIAVSGALDHLEKQAVKYKTKWESKKRSARKSEEVKKWNGHSPEPEVHTKVGLTEKTAVPVAVHRYPPVARTTEVHLVRSDEAVAMRPMTLEEAIKEAHFRDRDVFVFRDPKGQSDDPAPHSRRQDGADRSSVDVCEWSAAHRHSVADSPLSPFIDGIPNRSLTLALKECPVIGQVLGHCRVVAKIGEGGMGVVYRAYDEVLHRDVALKVVKKDARLDASSSQRLLHEARASSGSCSSQHLHDSRSWRE